MEDAEGSVSFSYGHKGLEYCDAVGDQKTFLPVDASFALNIGRLPVAEIQEMLLGTFGGGKGGGNLAALMGASIGMQLHPLLETAGSIIALKVILNAPETGVAFDSKMTPNGAVEYKTTGELNSAIRGLEVLLKWIDEHPEKVESAKGWVELLKHSKKNTNAKGATIDSFRIEFRQKGRATINGKKLIDLAPKKFHHKKTMTK